MRADLHDGKANSDIGLYLGVSFATTLGHAGLVSLPFEIGAIVDGLKLSTSAGGLLVTVELIAYALTNILIAPVIGRLSTRRIAQAGTLLVIAAGLLTSFTTDLFIFAFARAVAGIGFGIIFACANVAGAAAKSPERAYAIGLGVSVLFYAVLPSLLSRSADIVGVAPNILLPHAGPFIAMVLFSIVMLPTMVFLPLAPTASISSKGSAASLGAKSKLALLPSTLCILVMTFFALAVFSIYTYTERRAHALNMTPHEIGLLLSFGFGIGMVGTVLSGWMGHRFGTTRPLVIGLLIQGAACLGLAISGSQAWLWISVAGYQILWFFLYPYIFGLAAGLDPVGRLATAVGGVYLVGAAIAASLGGFVVQYGGFSSVGYMSLGLCIFGAIICVPIAKLSDREVQQPQSA